MSDEAELQAYREFFAKLDIRPLIKRALYGGFDSYEDYEKYGDAFTPLKLPPLNERVLRCEICQAGRTLQELLEDPRYDIRWENFELEAECDGCGVRAKFLPEPRV